MRVGIEQSNHDIYTQIFTVGIHARPTLPYSSLKSFPSTYDCRSDIRVLPWADMLHHCLTEHLWRNQQGRCQARGKCWSLECVQLLVQMITWVLFGGSKRKARCLYLFGRLSHYEIAGHAVPNHMSCSEESLCTFCCGTEICIRVGGKDSARREGSV
jgi:hypothetical protein